ncbi:unnamed protein product, partial [Vitis vinifera]
MVCKLDLYSSGSDIDDFSSHWCTKTDHPSSQDLRIRKIIFLIHILKVCSPRNTYSSIKERIKRVRNYPIKDP